MSQSQPKTSVIQYSLRLLQRLIGHQPSPATTIEDKPDTLKTKPLPIMLLSSENTSENTSESTSENTADHQQLQVYKALDTSG